MSVTHDVNLKCTTYVCAVCCVSIVRRAYIDLRWLFSDADDDVDNNNNNNNNSYIPV